MIKDSLKRKIKASKFGKGLAIITVLVLLCTGLSAITATAEPQITETQSATIAFSAPEQTTDGKLIMADMQQSKHDEKLLPSTTRIFEFPLGTIIQDVSIAHSDIQTMTLDMPVPDAPPQLPLIKESNHPILSKIGNLLQKRFSKTSQQDQPQTTVSLSSVSIDIIDQQPFCNIGTYVGRNQQGGLSTFVVAMVQPCEINGQQVSYITDMTVDVEYIPGSTALEESEEYDLLILAPSSYIADLQPLVEHKKDMGLKTKVVSLDEIYNEVYFELTEQEREQYNRDEQETIKYFIYNAVDAWNVDYIMAVGGYRTLFGLNNPNKQFPVRYSHLDDGAEPGYACDQYYSCFLRYDDNEEGYVFDTWDSNGNDRFAEWDWSGYDWYDPMPDVYFGRLACRNRIEVRTMVEKIIIYETETHGSEWFNDMITITGDGFGDLDDLAVAWNTRNEPQGMYTIYAQSRLKADPSVVGPSDFVEINLDHTAESRVSFYEDDHLNIEPLTEEQETLYPGKPVAEIVVPQTDDILGNTDVSFNPPEAYCSDYTGWGRVDYKNKVLSIRSKSYDPSTQESGDRGSHTQIKIWVNNSDGETVFESTWRDSNTYYEGEMECLKAIDYMPGFDQTKLFASNGNWYTMNDVIESFSEGYGFCYFAGHGNPMSWGDHLPGIPGGRDDGMINGLKNVNLDFGIARYEGDEGDPMFPMDTLSNGLEQPVTLIGGCHNSYIDASFTKLFMDPQSALFSVLHGAWIPESFSWWLTRMLGGGSIATIGCSGLGYGILGEACTDGLGGWINPEFFRVYSQDERDILGETFTQTITNYANRFNTIGDQTDRKTFEEWILLGDPSLKIGGYSTEESSLDEDDGIATIVLPNTRSDVPIDTNKLLYLSNPLSNTEFQVTYNTGLDENPQSILTSTDGKFLVGYSYETPSGTETHPGFATSNGGGMWQEIIYANSVDSGCSSLTDFQVEDEKRYTGSIAFDSSNFGAIHIPDFTDPNTWTSTQYYFPSGVINTIGLYGMAVTGYGEEGHFGGVWSCIWEGSDALLFMFSEDQYVHGILGSKYHHFAGDVDNSENKHYWVCEAQDVNQGVLFVATPPDSYNDITIQNMVNPDITAEDGNAYLVYESGNSVICYRSTDSGETWRTNTVTTNGQKPKVLIEENGDVACYFTQGNHVIKAVSVDNGNTWTEEGQISDTEVDTSMFSPFIISNEGMIYAKDDGDLYANIFLDTTGAYIGAIEAGNGAASATIMNTGTTDLTYFDCKVNIEGDSPLGRYFGLGGTIFENFFKGRVLNGEETSTYVLVLESGDTMSISSGPVLGFGHVLVTIQVIDSEDEILAEKSEDGFLLGGRLFLHHEEE